MKARTPQDAIPSSPNLITPVSEYPQRSHQPLPSSIFHFPFSIFHSPPLRLLRRIRSRRGARGRRRQFRLSRFQKLGIRIRRSLRMHWRRGAGSRLRIAVWPVLKTAAQGQWRRCGGWRGRRRGRTRSWGRRRRPRSRRRRRRRRSRSARRGLYRDLDHLFRDAEPFPRDRQHLRREILDLRDF